MVTNDSGSTYCRSPQWSEGWQILECAEGRTGGRRVSKPAPRRHDFPWQRRRDPQQGSRPRTSSLRRPTVLECGAVTQQIRDPKYKYHQLCVRYVRRFFRGFRPFFHRTYLFRHRQPFRHPFHRSTKAQQNIQQSWACKCVVRLTESVGGRSEDQSAF